MSLRGLKAPVTLVALESLGLCALVLTRRLRVTTIHLAIHHQSKSTHEYCSACHTREGRRSVDLTWAELPQFAFQVEN